MLYSHIYLNVNTNASVQTVNQRTFSTQAQSVFGRVPSFPGNVLAT